MLTQIYTVISLFAISNHFDLTNGALTMEQLDQSMAMFRMKCVEKIGIEPALIDGLHKGIWPDDDKKLKCFTLCIAETAGTLTKKKELSEPKIKKHIETQLPAELREFALGALGKCKEVQKRYEDPCDKTYYSTKCMYDYSPKDFIYP